MSFMSKRKGRLIKNDILGNKNIIITIKTFIFFIIEITSKKSTFNRSKLMFIIAIGMSNSKTKATKYVFLRRNNLG